MPVRGKQVIGENVPANYAANQGDNINIHFAAIDDELGFGPLGGFVVVAKNGDDATGDGSIFNPYLTIQFAIDNSSSGDVIKIYPGVYVENLTLDTALIGTTRTLVGVGDGRAENVTIRNSTNNTATLTCTGTSGAASFSFINLHVDNDNGQAFDSCLGTTGTMEGPGIYFRDCSFTTVTPEADPCILINHEGNAQITFDGGVYEGLGTLGIGAVTSGTTRLISFINMDSPRLYISQFGATVNIPLVSNCVRMGCVTHTTFVCTLKNIGELVAHPITGVCLESTAIAFGNLIQLQVHNVVCGIDPATDTFGEVIKTGSCNYLFDRFARDPIAFPIGTSGTRIRLGASAQDLAALPMPEPVFVATSSDTTLSGFFVVDGLLLVNNNRVLVKNQTDPTENGIYHAHTGAWTRAPDCDSRLGPVMVGQTVIVRGGFSFADTFWTIQDDGVGEFLNTNAPSGPVNDIIWKSSSPHRQLSLFTSGTIEVEEADSGRVFSNTGASAPTTYNLPPAPATKLLRYTFIHQTATAGREINIVADGTDVIRSGDAETAAGGTITSVGPGSVIELMSTGDGAWTSFVTGSWDGYL